MKWEKTPRISLNVSLLFSLADQSGSELWDRSEDWLRREERGAAQRAQTAQHSVLFSGMVVHTCSLLHIETHELYLGAN